MKHAFLTLLFGLAIPAYASSQIKTVSSSGHDEQLFRKLEREMFDATQGKPDLVAFGRIWADDFYSINHDGSAVDKQQTAAVLKAGQFFAEKITSDDFKLRRYGDTAVVTGRSSYFVGGAKVGEVRHTQIWVKRK
jgi:hypothetical protein